MISNLDYGVSDADLRVSGLSIELEKLLNLFIAFYYNRNFFPSLVDSSRQRFTMTRVVALWALVPSFMVEVLMPNEL